MRTQLFINTADNRTVPILNNMFADNLANWVELNGVTPHYINNKLFVYNNESIQITQEINSNLGRYKVEINVCEIPGTTGNAGAITAGFGDYASYFDLVTNYNYSLGVNTFYVNVGVDATNCKEFLIALSGDFNQSISSVYVYDISEEYKEVELYDDALIPLNFNILSITDLNSKKSNYSKTINIPGTKNNNIIFGHIYNVNNYGAFILNKPVKAYIIEDGLTYNFNFELINCKTYLNKDTEYEGILYSNLTDLYTKIGNKKIRGNENVLEDIDFSENDVLLNTYNIEESWNPSNNSGITFHMIDKYDKYSYALNIANNWKVEELTGALYIKEIFDKILRDAGYTYTSTFLNASYFKRLILPNLTKYNNLPSEVVSMFSGVTSYDSEGFYGYELPLVSSGNAALLTYSQNDDYDSNIINQYNDVYLYKFSFTDASGALNSSAVNNSGYTNGILDTFMSEYTFNTIGLFNISADIKLSPVIEFVIPDAGWKEDIGNPGNATSRLYSDTSKIVKYELVFEHEGIKTILASTEFNGNAVYDAVVGGNAYFDNDLYYFNDSAQELYKKAIINLTGSTNTLSLEPTEVQVAIGDKLYVREKITNPRYYTGTTTWIDKYWDWDEETWYNCNVILRTLYGQSSIKGIGNTSTITIGGPTYSTLNNLVYANMLVPDMKQIDLIQNISKMFNLVWEDVDDKSFVIEPFNDYKNLEHETIDITEYVDMSNDIEVSRSNFLNLKTSTFAYTDDQDFFNIVYKTYEEASYGCLNGNNSLVGKYNSKSSEVESCLVTFAPTVCGDLVSTGSVMQTPKIYKFKEDPDWEVDFGVKFLPRILYFKGKVNQVGARVVLSDSNNVEQSSYNNLYPYTSNFDDIGIAGSPYTYDLNFANNNYYWSTLPLLIHNDTLFDNFYINRYTEMIDDTSYKVELTAVLPSTFVHNFKFNDVVWFKDAYYYVSEIKDFVAGKSCTVVLVKQLDIDIQFTNPPIKPVKPVPKIDYLDIIINSDVQNKVIPIYIINGDTTNVYAENMFYLDKLQSADSSGMSLNELQTYKNK